MRFLASILLLHTLYNIVWGGLRLPSLSITDDAPLARVRKQSQVMAVPIKDTDCAMVRLRRQSVITHLAMHVI